jgi:hypothetical protein
MTVSLSLSYPSSSNHRVISLGSDASQLGALAMPCLRKTL